MTEVQKAHRNLLVQVRQVKQTGYLVQTSRKEGAKGESHVIIGMFPNVQNSKFQVDANLKTGVRTHTAKPADATKHSASIASHIPSNDERQMQNGKLSRVTRPKTEWDFIMSRTRTFSKVNWDVHLESSRLELKISETRALRHSRKDLSWTLNKEEKQGKQL